MGKISPYMAAPDYGISVGFFGNNSGPAFGATALSSLTVFSNLVTGFWSRRRKAKNTIAALETLDDAILRDIGLSRGEIYWRATSISPSTAIGSDG